MELLGKTAHPVRPQALGPGEAGYTDDGSQRHLSRRQFPQRLPLLVRFRGARSRTAYNNAISFVLGASR